MIPASRFYFLICLCLLVTLVIATFGQVTISASLWGMLGCDLLLIILAWWDGYQVRKNRVEVERYPLSKLSIGRDNPVVIVVRAADLVARVRIKDYYPAQLAVSTITLAGEVEKNSSRELSYSVHPHQRGEFTWGGIQVRQLGRWGLAWHNWRVAATQKVAVYPDLVGLRSLSIRLAIANSGTMRQARRIGIGTEFAELREYATGDDTRMIDWKATARRSRPLVRVLEPQKEQTLIILLDRGRLMTATVKGMRRFDWGLNATLSLALAGLNRGDKVGVGVFDREVTTWIPPERGQHQLSSLVERLTPIEPVLLEPDYFGAVTRLVTRQTRRALVVLITDLVDVTASAELLAAMSRLTPRYLPFCVALRDPQVDYLAHNCSEVELEAAYTRAVALDLLSQRQVAFAKLKQRGVLVLDAPVDKISDQLVDRYLQVKARNLL